MDEQEKRKSGQELKTAIELWEAFLKSPQWDLFKNELMRRRLVSAVELRKPARNMAGVLKTEGMKYALSELETIINLPTLMVEDMKAELKMTGADEDD